MDTFSEFKRIAVESWRILIGRKKLLLFPLLPFLVMLPFMIVFFLMIPGVTQGTETPRDVLFLVIPMALLGFLLQIPFLMAIMAILKEMDCTPVSISRGIGGAFQHIRQILWGFLICLLPFLLIGVLMVPLMLMPNLIFLMIVLWIPCMIIGIGMGLFWFYFFPAAASNPPETGIRELCGNVFAAIRRGWAFPLLYMALMFVISLLLQVIMIPLSIVCGILAAVLVAAIGPEAGAIATFMPMIILFPLMMIFTLMLWVYQTIFSALSYRAVRDCDSCRH